MYIEIKCKSVLFLKERKKKEKKWRQKGGIEPLCIAASTDLKSAPRTTSARSGKNIILRTSLYKGYHQ